MKKTLDDYGYIACPHTAVGLEALHRYRQETADTSPIITLACAHPAKFPEAVRKALGHEPPREAALDILSSRPTNVQTIKPTLKALKAQLL
jgi:threonine synthase